MDVMINWENMSHTEKNEEQLDVTKVEVFFAAEK